ncbi:hypothetical protein V2A60_001827 [Cordyceps javanica]|uniref:ATP synthase subunit K, mitochondrial n=1 Tax=Cordyceps javanica TaxID=43265 RepID=A0A545WDP2_9HYPO|nr:hypothetical protein IF1G_00716 [Cordyceps javanica]TQW11965.1 hypothetical protein IF2G_00696 [Cordyceps javanica]
MGASYTIAGRQIGSHYLAMGWLATFAGGIYYVASGPKAPAPSTAAPPINAASSDEADFIKKFIEQADKKN